MYLSDVWVRTCMHVYVCTCVFVYLEFIETRRGLRFPRTEYGQL